MVYNFIPQLINFADFDGCVLLSQARNNILGFNFNTKIKSIEARHQNHARFERSKKAKKEDLDVYFSCHINQCKCFPVSHYL